MTAPSETPDASAIVLRDVLRGPRSAKSRSAVSRMRALAERSSNGTVTFSVIRGFHCTDIDTGAIITEHPWDRPKSPGGRGELVKFAVPTDPALRNIPRTRRW